MFEIYKGKRVLLTGHTGFKGSWMALWLETLGAKVMGISLPAPSEPSHFDLLKLSIDSRMIDIRNREELNKAVEEFKPEIVFHLAAQPLVRYSYDFPIETYETNVMGTLNVLEACRRIDAVRAIVCITTDKCYENKEWVWGYRENDPMGGYDPYSSSKGCAELLISSYRNSYFNPKDFGTKHHTLLASGRAGNVIGGGDWALDRLVPDIIRAASKHEKVLIRNPHATRPWQHVLEPLRGYMMLGVKLLEGKKEFAEAWNFGPNDDANISVGEVLTSIKGHWDQVDVEFQKNVEHPHEANLLMLDCSKAKRKLGWQPVLTPAETFEMTAKWYKDFYLESKISTRLQIENYLSSLK